MLDINLKNDKCYKNKYKIIITWSVRVLAIIAAVFVIIINNENKILKLTIIALTYVNVMLLISFMANQARVYYVWKLLYESISEIENSKKLLKDIKYNELMYDDYEVIIGKYYKKSIKHIKKMFYYVKVGVKNTVKNEKMNIELVNNLTNKLDKPLKDILDNIEMISKNPEEEEKSLEILSEKSNNLKILIEELFEASKIASGDLEFNIEDIEIVALLKQSLVEFKEKIDSSTLIFKVNVPKEKILIKGNGEKLWRVFNILIENTLKHSLDNSRVYIDIINIEEKVYVTIKNTSKSELNVDAKDLLYIMNSNEEECASGLGLEIAKNLIKLQNGEFNLYIDGDLFKVEIIFNKDYLTKKSEESAVG